jgi:hypothetical protein
VNCKIHKEDQKDQKQFFFFMKKQGYDSLSSHSFRKIDAINYGICPAILLQHIRYTVQYNAEIGRNIRKHNGIDYSWTFDSAREFAIAFPYMTEQSIGRYLRKLEKEKELIVDEFNTKRYDRTKWYTVPIEEKEVINEAEKEMRFVNVFDAKEFGVVRAVILNKLREELATLGEVEDYTYYKEIKQKKILRRLPFFTKCTLISALKDLENSGVIEIQQSDINYKVKSYRFCEDWLSKFPDQRLIRNAPRNKE